MRDDVDAYLAAAAAPIISLKLSALKPSMVSQPDNGSANAAPNSAAFAVVRKWGSLFIAVTGPYVGEMGMAEGNVSREAARRDCRTSPS